MGGVSSVFPADEVKEIATETMTTFVPQYAKGFAIALIREMKAQREARPSEYLLLSAPPNSEVLREGVFQKLGAVKQNWKERHFVAHNDDQNYVIKYYTEPVTAEDDEKTAAKKLKGEVHLCWYRAKVIKDEEKLKKWGSEHVIVVKPWWRYDRRRHWVFRFKNADDKKDWLGTLQNSCYKSRAPLNPDPIMNAAFKIAYLRTRWELGVWGWCSYYKTEQEMLSQMIVDRLEAGIMQPVWAKCSGRTGWMLRKPVQNALDATVGAAVAAGWKSASAAISAAKPKIEEVANKSLGPIIDKQLELQRTIAEKVSEKVNPVISEACAPVLAPIINAMAKPFYNAHAKAVGVFAEKVKDAITRQEAGVENPGKYIKGYNNSCWWYYGPLNAAYREIRKYTRPNLVDADDRDEAMANLMKAALLVCADLFGLDVWDIEDKLESAICRLTMNACYTYISACDAGAEGKMDRAIADKVLGRYIHDARLNCREQLCQILFDLLEPKISEKVTAITNPIIEPIDSLIPEPFKVLLDIKDMCATVIAEIVRSACFAAIDATATEAVFSQLDTIAPAGVVVPAGLEDCPALAFPTPEPEAGAEEKKEGEAGDAAAPASGAGGAAAEEKPAETEEAPAAAESTE